MGDPFRLAPFDPFPLMAEREKARKGKEERRETLEVDSDTDEQRLAQRRSFSYEHIDGVGDDASSDSRVRESRLSFIRGRRAEKK